MNIRDDGPHTLVELEELAGGAAFLAELALLGMLPPRVDRMRCWSPGLDVTVMCLMCYGFGNKSWVEFARLSVQDIRASYFRHAQNCENAPL